MNTPKAISFTLMIAVIVVVVYVAIAHRPTAQAPEKIHAVQLKAVENVSASAVVSSVEIPVPETEPSAPGNKTHQAPVAQKKIAATQSSKPAKVKPPIQDPDAREALGLVGVDPMAEQYWLTAISDPTLPAEERKDLMEDLNEDGLSDPKHPTPEDLALIKIRIAIIERILPQADEFMLPPLGEAYKDLNNLLAGKPVQ